MPRKYRFLLIQAFHLPKESQYLHRPVEGSKEKKLMNFENGKAMVDLELSASGLVYPTAHPKKWRRKKLF